MSGLSNFGSIFVCLFGLILIWGSRSCQGYGTYGFDVHHRYSDPVKGILDLDGLPEKGTLEYYNAMAHRDQFIKGRRLADAGNTSSMLTFTPGNETYRLNSLGFLHYANVSVGTPSLSFLVALDTGSDLFWLPCDCTSCVHGIRTRNGRIDFNIYSPNTSTTSTTVPCNSSMCAQQRQCNGPLDSCAYQVRYLSNGTSSTGILVEDVLHLITDDSETTPVSAGITFGCGMVQTGSFLDGAAPNGLFGLGMEDVSVPSILATKGLASNSFSMCFGADGIGRITFGDKGSSDQGETPFSVRESHPTYNVTVDEIIVGDNATTVSFSAIFDSGTSFTYLNDPAYTIISENFNSLVTERRHPPDSSIPFDYCYELSATQTSFDIPMMNLTMRGGDQFYVTDPIVILSLDGMNMYCLAMVKSGDINIIGQNFMTGHRIIFDREKMVLGWKLSNCYEALESNGTNTLPIDPRNSTAAPPTSIVEPEATSNNGAPIGSPNAALPSSPRNSSNSLHLNSFAPAIFTVFVFLFVHHFNILFP